MTHFHVDHSADLLAILKGAEFSDRKQAYPLSGPIHGGLFSNATEFLNMILEKATGIFAYLHWIFIGTDDFFKLDHVTNIDYKSTIPTKVFSKKDFTVWALRTPKGDIPNFSL